MGGVDASNNRGIWIGTSDEDLHLVVRTGDVIGGNVLTRLPAVGQDNQFDMNQNEVLWVGSFGPTTAIVVSRAFGGSDVVDDRFSLVFHPSATGPRGHETRYSVRRRWRRGRLVIGAWSPFSSWTRSPASTPYCDYERTP